MRPSGGPGTALCAAELRSLDFFRHTVAPVLSGPLNDVFWTRLALQVAEQEPAARHAVVAISALFEKFDQQDPRKDQPQHFAIGHYNSAIRHIATAKTQIVDSVLVLCILFTCIEFLRGNTDAAVNHCRSGIEIFNSKPTYPGLSAILSHLSVFPFFFGETLSNFPQLVNPFYPTIDTLQTLADAQQSLDCLVSRSVRFVRLTDPWRFGTTTRLDAFSTLLLEQQKLQRDLYSWFHAASELRNEQASITEDTTAFRLLEIKWLVCKVWTSICLCHDEMASDAHQENFERIVELSTQEQVARHRSATKSPKFIFGMGFSPVLYFVAMKCRYLHTRLAALSLMKTLACARESSWDSDILYATGLRIIELEHGFELTPEPTAEIQEMGNPTSHLPTNNQRIKDNLLEEDAYEHVDHRGRRMTRRKICLFYPALEGTGVRTVWDWITVPRAAHCGS